jgi:putative SOS response-associated peptidase YedK
VLEPFHDRCPLIIEPKDYKRWLTPFVKEDPSTVPVELLKTYPSESMKAWPVNPIGRDANGPELLEPLKVEPGSSPSMPSDSRLKLPF